MKLQSTGLQCKRFRNLILVSFRKELLFATLIFERELASLVALQVVSSKEEGEEEENFLTSFNNPRLEA